MSKPIALQKKKQKSHKILLVDDDSRILNITSQALEYEGYQVATVTSGEAAIEALYTRDFDLVITDLFMGQVDGISVLKKAKESNPEVKVIIMTGNFDIHFVIEALRRNADDYILKPFTIDELLNRVSNFIGKPSALGLHHREHIKII